MKIKKSKEKIWTPTSADTNIDSFFGIVWKKEPRKREKKTLKEILIEKIIKEQSESNSIACILNTNIYKETNVYKIYAHPQQTNKHTYASVRLLAEQD